MDVKRIAIVYPFDSYETVPCVCSLIDVAREKGFEVDIYLKSGKNHSDSALHEDGLSIIRYSLFEENLGIFSRFYIVRLFFCIIRKFSDKTADSRIYEQIVTACKSRSYLCIVGVEPEGLHIAKVVSYKCGVRFYYWSLELLFSGELPGIRWKLIKKQEIKESAQSYRVLIQDKERAAKLSEINDIPEDKFIFIPNSPVLRAEPGKTGYWHNKFDLNDNTKIVLYSGGIKDWSLIDLIAGTVSAWPEEWIFVIHCVEGNGSISNDIKNKFGSDRIRFSGETVPPEMFGELISSADIGIAFYGEYRGPFGLSNIKYIGLSSGKISYYMRCGIPVIVNSWPSVSKYVAEYRTGVVCDGRLDIASAIELIMNDYKGYSQRARSFFKDILDPLGGIERFISTL